MTGYRHQEADPVGHRTAARTTALMKKHHVLARRLADRQDDYLRFTRDFRVSSDWHTGTPPAWRPIPLTFLSVEICGQFRYRLIRL